MIRRINESNSFTDDITSNPTWQMVNRIAKKYGYRFDPYARVEVHENGNRYLEDIGFNTDDEELPSIDIDTGNALHYLKEFDVEFNVREPITSLDYDGYLDYLDKLSKVTDMIDELSDVDFSTLYEDYIDE